MAADQGGGEALNSAHAHCRRHLSMAPKEKVRNLSSSSTQLIVYPCLNARQELYRVAEVSAQFRDHVADGLLPRLVKPLGHLVELFLQEGLHFFHLLPKGHNTV